MDRESFRFAGSLNTWDVQAIPARAARQDFTELGFWEGAMDRESFRFAGSLNTWDVERNRYAVGSSVSSQE